MKQHLPLHFTQDAKKKAAQTAKREAEGKAQENKERSLEIFAALDTPSSASGIDPSTSAEWGSYNSDDYSARSLSSSPSFPDYASSRTSSASCPGYPGNPSHPVHHSPPVWVHQQQRQGLNSYKSFHGYASAIFSITLQQRCHLCHTLHSCTPFRHLHQYVVFVTCLSSVHAH